MMMSESDLTIIDFDRIDMHDVKYLPWSFDGNILFVLRIVAMGTPNVFGHSMEDMEICVTDILGVQ